MAGSALDIQRFKGDGRHVVEPRGDIDLATARELGTVLREEVEERPEELVVDLSETTHLDSTGVAVLLNAQRRLTRAGSHFAVVAPAGPPRRVLEHTGVADTLRLRSAVGPAG
jgi:anti-sigma B factor antagonist